MFLTLFVILLVMWLLGFFAFHVAGGLIHLLLIIAVISLAVHFFRAIARLEEHGHALVNIRNLFGPVGFLLAAERNGAGFLGIECGVES